jgi:hypothetical protein
LKTIVKIFGNGQIKFIILFAIYNVPNKNYLHDTKTARVVGATKAECIYTHLRGDFMQAIKAIYDGIHFKPKQPIPVSGQYEVVITFVEQISANSAVNPQDQISSDINFWKEFDRLTTNASDEVLSLDDFPRTKFNRELVIFDDEV